MDKFIVQEDRRSDRLVAIKVVVSGSVLNVICAYAPQAGLGVEEKRVFWEALDDLIRDIPMAEQLVIGGDFSGHIGRDGIGYDEAH